MAVVLVADKLDQAAVDRLVDAGHRVVLEPALQDGALVEALRAHQAEVLVVRSTKVRADAIGASGRLGLVVRAGAGVDNIDARAASQAGVCVSNCPGMNAAAVAELAMGLLLACDRSLPAQAALLREGRWDKKGFGRTSGGLKGRTLGLVGLGAIGRLVADRARAFEMDVAAWSRSLDEEWCSRRGVQFGGRDRSDLAEMLGGCDAVSVHVALTDETRHLCDEAFFEAMRPGSIFVNTSRARVVDEAALRRAVRAKGLRCGLDVHEAQPAEPEGAFSSETFGLPGVIGTHHNGASTAQAQLAVGEEVVRIIEAFADRGERVNCTNSEQLQAAAARSP